MNLKNTALGIELGSTRIKAVLIDENHIPIASGSHEWENQLVDGIWTYSMEAVTNGIQDCYADLKRDVQEKFGTVLTEVGAIGVSAMMHGYLPFDKDGNQLAAFRTWRNTITGEAAAKLSDALNFNIPQRWSIAHLYQAILNKESHVKDIAFLTTLAGYIHFKLTGEKVMGIGEASGMFPINSEKLDFDQRMVDIFDTMSGMPWKLRDILPKVLCAGDRGGVLTEAGAWFLDPQGGLKSGIPVAPCEGDAGAGMVATNSVRERTGNVSAGTSDFAMIVTDHALGVHREIDMVTTPAGAPVAMVHCNNCTSDINAWVNLLGEFAQLIGAPQDKGALFTMLFRKALEGDADCGGLVSYNYFSGEGVTDLDEGRPVFARTPNASFTLANFMRTHLYTSLGALKTGLDILMQEEGVTLDNVTGHGGLFKTPGVGQRILAAAMNTPVTCMETAGEGGPWGMAILAAYMMKSAENPSLEKYLADSVFACSQSTTVSPEQADVDGFNAFMQRYAKGLSVEKAAVDCL